MTVFVENEIHTEFPFDPLEVASQVAEAVLDAEDCPYETEINVLITDDEGIRVYNREYRNMDSATDVLSFPNVPFERPADFSAAERSEADCFQPESGELILGDIAFLVAHSMLHLCGYDHMEPQEAAVMEEKQERILDGLRITREITD